MVRWNIDSRGEGPPIQEVVLRRYAFLAAAAFAALATHGACTQDFDQFEPRDSASPTGSGSGGGGTTPDASSTTTTSSTSSGGGPSEDCLNGTDDDRDNDVDCADSDCGQFVCVEVPPAWNGPVLLFLGPADDEPECPDGFSERVELGGQDPAATAMCSACTCTPEVTCSLERFVAHRGDDCDGPSAESGQLPAGTCLPLAGGFFPGSYSAGPPEVDDVTCTPSIAQPTGPAPRFSTVAIACGASAAGRGCRMNSACVPAPTGDPFEDAICVWIEGDEPCPGDFGERHLVASDVIDGRSCSPCECDAGEASCAATTTVFRDPFCANPVSTVPNDDSCHTDAPPAIALIVEVTSDAACSVSGGEPIGSVELGAERRTVCCRH